MKESQFDPQSDAEILREFGLLFSPEANLSQFAGLEVFLKFLDRGDFRARWTQSYGGYRARTMIQFMIGLVVGARSMLEIGEIAKDPLIARYIGNPVEEAQLGRDMRSFTKPMLQELHDTVISYSVFDFARVVPQAEILEFDIDATAVIKYGEQEGVEEGYIEEDKIEACYQYLFVRLHNRNTLFYGTIRAGSTHSQNDFCGYLSRFLPMLKDRWRSVWRADSGYYNEAAFDLFSSNDATFFIKAPMSPTRLALATSSPDIVWSVEKDGTSYASRMTMTAAQTKFREIFKRTRLNDKQAKRAGSVYRYDCVVTNDFGLPDETAFAAYNVRANVENTIRELKNDYQLGKIVTDSFDANDAITQLTLLTYLLVKHLQAECLPPKLKKTQLNRLRNYVFNVPGRVLRQARAFLTRIQNLFANENLYAFILRQLKYVRSWVLSPPVFVDAA